MIYIFSALYAEAQPLIERYRLKKKSAVHGVDSFQDEERRMILSLTGSGVYRAVFAVSSVLAVIPPGAEDELLFFGSAACVSSQGKNNLSAGQTSGLYRIREIRDLASGRRYYPDLIRKTGLPDAAVVTGMHVYYRQPENTGTEMLSAVLPDDELKPDVPVLYDMESSGVCEAASRHMGPHQITILRFVSDEGMDGEAETAAPAGADEGMDADAESTAPAGAQDGMTASAARRQAMRETISRKARAAAPAAERIIDGMIRRADMQTDEKNSCAMGSDTGELLAECLHCSASMRSELMQYLKYADLAGISWRGLAEKIRQDGCADRREGKMLLRRLESEILTSGSIPCEGSSQSSGSLMPPFHSIYIERAVAGHPRTRRILASFPGAERICVENYREIFDRHRQNYPLQQASRALILAQNTGELIHKGSPVCQSFDNRYFYYCSSVMNCPYDCNYCWLKGMYESGNLVIFVNLEDTFHEVEALLRQHPVYLCVSYDTDLLALEPLTGYAGLWSEFAASHENLTIEIRTKGVARLPELVPSERTILAFTLSPEEISRRFERQAPGLEMRTADIREAMEKNFPVRLCFDPVIVFPGWKKSMLSLMKELDRTIDWQKIRDVSIGTFRISADYIRRMRTRYPDSVLLQYPYVCSDGYYHLPDETDRDTVQYMTELLAQRTGRDRLFFWREL